MKTFNVWEVKQDLVQFGFWYCVWMGHSLFSIFVAWNIGRHTRKVCRARLR